ncbi:MAG: T9SS type A sorting domain-containing protein [Hymenobacter sp.]|nr:MAG: T9SS type A sorting domain-containing protein [Hymenobacter sp.]
MIQNWRVILLVGNAENPLPVVLTSFTATASEVNSKAFEVERSLDGVAFAKIGTLAAAGHSVIARTYVLLDGALPVGATTLYYRLRQVEQDGKAYYSAVRPVTLVSATAGLNVYPNPTHGGAVILVGAQPGTVATVLDALGRLVTTVPGNAMGTATLALPQGLATGVYVVRVGSQALRLLVE